MSGFETLSEKVGARPQWRGDKLGADGLLCPVCGEPKLGIDWARHQHGGAEWIVKVNCRTCRSEDYLARLAKAVGMTVAEILTGNDGLGQRYRRSGPEPRPSMQEVKRQHRALLGDPTRLAYVAGCRGVSREVIERFKIGHDGDRFWLPVFDWSQPFEVVVNLRKYLPGASERKMLSLRGAGAQLFTPIPDAGAVVICEGEWDALRAWSVGVPAVTNTGGASTWRDEWTERIGRRHVCVVYDRDRGGELGEAKVRESFERVGLHRSLTIVRLPLPRREKGGADLSDYLADHSKEDLMTLLRSSWRARHARSPGRSRDPRGARPTVTAKRREEQVP